MTSRADQTQDIIERAAHAFWQGGLASLPVSIPLTEDALTSALLAFVVAGGSAVLSVIKGMVKERRRRRKTG